MLKAKDRVVRPLFLVENRGEKKAIEILEEVSGTTGNEDGVFRQRVAEALSKAIEVEEEIGEER